MILLAHFLFGFIVSFVGSITPSMLNMTALKISLEKNKKEANLYALGVSFVVFIQVYVGVILTEYIAKNPHFLEALEKVGAGIFILLSVYFYRASKKEKAQVNIATTKKENSFLRGLLLSALNMFAIPFFCGVTATLEMFDLFNFDKGPIAFFMIGSLFGTFCILFLYGKYAMDIQKKTGKLTKDINLILSILTGLVAVFTIIKYFI